MYDKSRIKSIKKGRKYEDRYQYTIIQERRINIQRFRKYIYNTSRMRQIKKGENNEWRYQYTTIREIRIKKEENSESNMNQAIRM